MEQVAIRDVRGAPSKHLCAHQLIQVQRTDQSAVGADHQHTGHAMLLHQDRRHRPRARRRGSPSDACAMTSSAVSERRSCPHSMRRRRSPICEDAEHLLVGIDHSGETEALAGHLAQQLTEARHGEPRARTSLVPTPSDRARGSAACGRGCHRDESERAKSASRKPRASSSATASASPQRHLRGRAGCGARLSGQAS